MLSLLFCLIFFFFLFSPLQYVGSVVSLFSGFFSLHVLMPPCILSLFLLISMVSLTKDGHHLKSPGEPWTSSLSSLPLTLFRSLQGLGRSLSFPIVLYFVLQRSIVGDNRPSGETKKSCILDVVQEGWTAERTRESEKQQD